MRNKILISFIVIIIPYIQLLSQENYYWVGGQGNWSNLNKWRTITGEIPNEVPDAEDNVIFNENSFLQPNDTVFILTGNPTCKDMIWENIQMPVVIAGGSDATNMSIYGSLTFHPDVINEYLGNIHFMSQQQGETITCAKTRLAGNVYFDGEGEWILQDTLFVIDTTHWQSIFIDFIEPEAPNPIIIHNNGTINSNNQAIFCRGFGSLGELSRELIIENSDVFLIGNWMLNGSNLIFEANSSLITIGGNINNVTGDILYYNNIDVISVDGTIKNTNIQTFMHKVHFFGSGTVDGVKTPGQEGRFIIDTLLFDGFIGMMGPIPCEITGGLNNNIHYTQINLVMGYADQKMSNFHRIDYNGFFESYFKGEQNQIDSIHFNNTKGMLAGDNIVNNLLFFKTDGVLSGGQGAFNDVDHAVFSSDGIFGGSNIINQLTLNSGYWYLFGIDSLTQPGSYYTNTHIQTINQIEILNNGNCENGHTIFESSYKTVQAIIDNQGSEITTKYLITRDINNIGNTINVEKGIDIGNNVGFNFIDPHDPITLYWVQGFGEWNDPSHWSLSSGGAGGECPPTIRDNIFFDNNSGFTGGNVNINTKHAMCNDMMWENVANLPTLSGPDTNTLRIWGSVKLSEDMVYEFSGRVYFESEDDDEYETIDLTYSREGEPAWDLYNKTYFYGVGGKWFLESKMYNLYDTLFLNMGELKMIDDTLGCYNFNSMDTLARGLYLLGQTLVEVHQYQGDAWVLNGYGIDSIFFFDAGKSLIRSLGDITPPPGAPPGYCHIRTFAGELHYHNIEFAPGKGSMLKSESKCHYNLVDYYCEAGEAVGAGVIDTLSMFEGANGCKIKNMYEINFSMAYSMNDTLYQSHTIDTAIFFEEGALYGYHNIGYLEFKKKGSVRFINTIDTAVFLGNGEILGDNYYSQLVLSPNKRYTFEDGKTQTISDDFIANGLCDQPIRLESDSVGTQSNILYRAYNPTYTDFTVNYTSLTDINAVDDNGYQYVATNSIDLGNNTNWNFIEVNDDIFYWVGGSGNWGDWTHWSYESGGPPIDEECTPSEINTVIFDDNSFVNANDNVSVDVLNAYCKDMLWIHSESYKPVFIGADTTVLFIYGSLELNDSMDYKYEGIIKFNEIRESKGIKDDPDYILSAGKIILNDIYIQGIDDNIELHDDLTLFTKPNPPGMVFRKVHFEHGTFNTNGFHLSCGAVLSNYENPRTLIIENSEVTVNMREDWVWLVNGENLELFANNSTIYNEALSGTIMSRKGDSLKYYNIVLNNIFDSLANKNNITEYNVVSIQGPTSLVTGNYIADSILLRSNQAAMFGNSTTNVVIIDSLQGSINENHNINRCIVNKIGIIRGNNNIKYCVFHDDGYFFGENTFDTLVLYPGLGNAQGLGNWFYFEAEKSQTIIDSLYVKGNPCSNANISSYSPPKLAYLKKDSFEQPDTIICDYLNIHSVGAEGENTAFYAGGNSTPQPDPNNPPPGWIFENAQGYIYGFDGRTDHFCLGDEYVINAINFNGEENTLYFWGDGALFPGEITYTVTEPGTYPIRVQYSDDCWVDDYIILEHDYPPIPTIIPVKCTGDTIRIQIEPEGDFYTYEWLDLSDTSILVADLSYSNVDIWVEVTDTINKCHAKAVSNTTIYPKPVPQVYLGDEDIWVKFGYTATLNAGPGDSFTWTSDPFTNINNPGNQAIIVPGTLDPIEYKVDVWANGCLDSAFVNVIMWPPSRLGVPTAFSPNGDGINDVLYVKGSNFQEMTFRIYDRYGKLVFETSDQAQGWDGNVDGLRQEQEVYTYYLKVIYADSGYAEEKGNITLLR